jgi:hypothetical protein
VLHLIVVCCTMVSLLARIDPNEKGCQMRMKGRFDRCRSACRRLGYVIGSYQSHYTVRRSNNFEIRFASRRTQKPCTVPGSASRDAGGRAPASRETQKLQYKRHKTQSESIFYLTILRFCVSLRLPPSLPKCLGDAAYLTRFQHLQF